MFGSAITILIGVALVLTMPEGAAREGATAVIGLLGMGFNAVAIGRGTYLAIKNRKLIVEAVRNI